MELFERHDDVRRRRDNGKVETAMATDDSGEESKDRSVDDVSRPKQFANNNNDGDKLPSNASASVSDESPRSTVSKNHSDLCLATRSKHNKLDPDRSTSPISVLVDLKRSRSSHFGRLDAGDSSIVDAEDRRKVSDHWWTSPDGDLPFRKFKLDVMSETILATRIEGVVASTGERATVYKCHLCRKMCNDLGGLQRHLALHCPPRIERSEPYGDDICDDVRLQLPAHPVHHLRQHRDDNRYGYATMPLPGEAKNEAIDFTVQASPLASVVDDDEHCFMTNSDLVVPEETSSVVVPLNNVSETPDKCPNNAPNKLNFLNALDGGQSEPSCNNQIFDATARVSGESSMSQGSAECLRSTDKQCQCRSCREPARCPPLNPQLDSAKKQSQRDNKSRARKKISEIGFRRTSQRLALVTSEMLAASNRDADVSSERRQKSASIIDGLPPPPVKELAKEIRELEHLGDDVTVVIPSDVPLLERCETRSPHSTDGCSDMVLPDRSPSATGEIIQAPMKSIMNHPQFRSNKRRSTSMTMAPATSSASSDISDRIGGKCIKTEEDDAERLSSRLITHYSGISAAQRSLFGVSESIQRQVGVPAAAFGLPMSLSAFVQGFSGLMASPLLSPFVSGQPSTAILAGPLSYYAHLPTSSINSLMSAASLQGSTVAMVKEEPDFKSYGGTADLSSESAATDDTADGVSGRAAEDLSENAWPPGLSGSFANGTKCSSLSRTHSRLVDLALI